MVDISTIDFKALHAAMFEQGQRFPNRKIKYLEPDRLRAKISKYLVDIGYHNSASYLYENESANFVQILVDFDLIKWRDEKDPPAVAQIHGAMRFSYWEIKPQ